MLRETLDLRPRRSPILRVAALAAASLFLAQCGRADDSAPPPKSVSPQTSAPKPLVVAAPPPLNRQDLIAAAAAAAAAYADGLPPPNDALVGRTFSIRSGFGCVGPEDQPIREIADGRARWWWGPSHTTIRLGLKPADWKDSGLVPNATTEGQPALEAAEGFWIGRPWSANDSCPERVAGPQPPPSLTAPSPDTLGLVALFQADDSRATRRKGRGYSFAQRSEDDAPLAAPTRGYRVLFEGRVSAFPDGRAISCRSPSIHQRPICVMAVQLDRVAFEDGQTGAIITEWRDG